MDVNYSDDSSDDYESAEDSPYRTLLYASEEESDEEPTRQVKRKSNARKGKKKAPEDDLNLDSDDET